MRSFILSATLMFALAAAAAAISLQVNHAPPRSPVAANNWSLLD